MLPLTKMEQHIDYLYHRHQVSLFMADNADCEQSRRLHRELADWICRADRAGQSLARSGERITCGQGSVPKSIGPWQRTIAYAQSLAAGSRR